MPLAHTQSSEAHARRRSRRSRCRPAPRRRKSTARWTSPLWTTAAHLLAFERMDGARPASIAISLVKAQAAAMRRSPTGPAMAGEQFNLPLGLGLAIANPAEQTPIRGGVPLLVDGQVVGAIGVSAGTEDQDLDVARAGAAALEKA